jgi:hypothetical protein
MRYSAGADVRHKSITYDNIYLLMGLTIKYCASTLSGPQAGVAAPLADPGQTHGVTKMDLADHAYIASADAAHCPIVALKILEDEAFDGQDVVGPNRDPEAEERHRERYERLVELATYAVPESIDGLRHLLIALDAVVDMVFSTAAAAIEEADLTHDADGARRMLRNAIAYADARVPVMSPD